VPHLLGVGHVGLHESGLATCISDGLGQCSEVADVVRYLCAPEAGYITGQVIAVDGGFGT
jgi:NAD(P)-dependent dehydrogenase (short-subunit alcohol dehydrogenase family)